MLRLPLEASRASSLSTSHFGTGGTKDVTFLLFLAKGNSLMGFMSAGFLLIRSIPAMVSVAL